VTELGIQNAGLFLYAVCELFDYRVGEHFAGDALDHGSRGVGAEAVGKRNGEILALAHGGYIGKADLAQGVVDGSGTLPVTVEIRQ